MAGFFLSSAEESNNRRGVSQLTHFFQPYASRFFLGVSQELFAHFPELIFCCLKNPKKTFPASGTIKNYSEENFMDNEGSYKKTFISSPLMFFTL